MTDLRLGRTQIAERECLGLKLQPRKIALELNLACLIPEEILSHLYQQEVPRPSRTMLLPKLPVIFEDMILSLQILVLNSDLHRGPCRERP